MKKAKKVKMPTTGVKPKKGTSVVGKKMYGGKSTMSKTHYMR